MLKILLSAVLFSGFVMNASSKEVVIDIRTPTEISVTGIVQGAVSADVQSKDFPERIKKLELASDDKIKLYCRSGRRAVHAQQILEQMGFKDVENLGGYEEASRRLNRPLVKP